MKYYSTNNPQHIVSFQEAVLNGLAPDGGLYMPQTIPSLSPDFIASLPSFSKSEIAFTVARPFVDEAISDTDLMKIAEETVAFDFPLISLNPHVHILELFHGPTLAFKDVGARFTARILQHISQQHQKRITVLVATSGDTGSAVAHGFYETNGIDVVILYPKGKVSVMQEKQFATLGKNIHAIAVDGTFDDCQRMVKSAFQDNDLRQTMFLTSANSINIARLLPQSFYYFFAWAALPTKQEVVFSVPSGNFGNLTAGVFAKKMGLPIHGFIAATNSNDVVPQYLETKQFSPRPSVQTISNAMDVGNPSNFARLLELYQNSWDAMTKDITGYSFTDEETQHAMQQVYHTKNYLLDPHGAVAWLGLTRYLKDHPQAQGISFETAHPCKFTEVVEASLHIAPPPHPSLQALLDKPVQSISCPTNFQNLKKILQNLIAR
ncbi:MAG: threonine synthase [Cyclobacteriaceae bacterium]|nr:threonine synthase [Cyclobacteriaceae bacterium]